MKLMVCLLYTSQPRVLLQYLRPVRQGTAADGVDDGVPLLTIAGFHAVETVSYTHLDVYKRQVYIPDGVFSMTKTTFQQSPNVTLNVAAGAAVRQVIDRRGRRAVAVTGILEMCIRDRCSRPTP